MPNATDWLAKYYPIPASETTADEAAEHSLRKWSGLPIEVLDEYELHGEDHMIMDAQYKSVLRIDDQSCALCWHFSCSRHLGHSGLPTVLRYVHIDQQAEGNLLLCPLFLVRDSTPCDKSMDGEDQDPYKTFLFEGDPGPMIEWLEKAVEFQRREREQAHA